MFSRLESLNINYRNTGMSERRVSVILFLVVMFGTFLQSIGCFTPGWTIEVFHTGDFSLYYEGLWFTVECRETCESYTYLEIYKQGLTSEFRYGVRVQYQVEALLSLIGCIVSCVLSFINVDRRSLKTRLQLLICLTLLTSGGLIWSVIGPYAAIYSIAAGGDSKVESLSMPFSMILSAVGSFLTVAVGVVNGKLLWQNLIPRAEDEINLHSNVQPSESMG